MRLVTVAVLVVAVVGCAGSKSAKPPSGQKLPPYTCQRTSGAITVDGKLDEPAWQQAQVIDQFYSLHAGSEPPFKPTADQPLSVRLLHDDRFIYVAARITDRDIVANPDSTNPQRRGRESFFMDGDVFEIFFVPSDREPSYYYEIHLTPTGAVTDLRLIASDYMGWVDRLEWNSGTRQAVQMTGTLNRMDEDEGWTAELAIPLKSLVSGLPASTQPASLQSPWRFAVCMYDYSWQNIADNGNRQTLRFIASVPLPRLDFHRRGDFQVLEFADD